MICTSWSWPNMFDVARGQVNLYRDTKSIVNRVKLLLLTEPTELYNNPNFGVGLKKYLFIYNTENVPAMIRDDLVEQLKIWEPGVIAEETQVTRGLNYTADPNSPDTSIAANLAKLNLTITLTTSRMKTVSFSVTSDDLNSIV